MINLYCYNSPSASSVGFQEGLWTVRNEICSVMNEKEASSQLRGLLLDGGAKAVCMDTERGTRAFMLRGIFVRQGAQSGWRMNIILETDQESYVQWLDVVASFLLNYVCLTEQLAKLFSVKYDGGEHYVLDTEGFEQLLRNANGASASLRDKTGTTISGQTALCAFTENLCVPFTAHPGRLLLLVPTATADYFMKHTSLKDLTEPEVCIGSVQWESILTHKVFEDAANMQWSRPKTQQSRSSTADAPSLSDAALFAIGAAGVALFCYSVSRIIKQSKRKGKGR